MPELPEVETIKRDLEKVILGRKITFVDIRLAKQIKVESGFFLKKVSGHKIIAVRRRAKNLILELDNGYLIIFHLKMTGQVIYRDGKKILGGGHPIGHNLAELPNKYSHIIFELSGNAKIFFNDTRQFGWVDLIQIGDFDDYYARTGPEPLDTKFTFTQFNELISRKKKPIKPLLMEVPFIAGIGNIYASEICFCAGVSPFARTNELTTTEKKKIFQCMKDILKLAVQKKGTSSRDYVDAFGRRGTMNQYLQVYQKDGETCPKCKQSKIIKVKQAGRSTFYCPACQK